MAKKKKPAPTAPRTALVVLGMHRSGTSALAGVLAKMGADLPQDLMEPAEMNAKGFFESNRITGLNEELLASAGKTWFSYDPVSPDWFASPKAAEFEARALDALEADYGRSHLFVVKDPRMCRLLPFWHRVFDQAGCRVLHVCTHRHPLEVAASMNRVSAYETDYAVNLWLRHVLEAEQASRGYPRVFTSYDRLMADSMDVVARIGTGLGLNWPRDLRAMAPELSDFLSKDLRNFDTLESDPYRQATLPTWVQKTLAIMERWVKTGEDKKDHTHLDQLQSAVADAADVMSPSVWQNQEKRWQLEAVGKQVAELKRSVQQAREEAASHAANHATEQKARVAAQARIAELDTAFKTAQQRAESLQADTANERQARVAAQARVAELDTALNAAKIDAERLQAKSAQDQKAYAALQSRVEQLDSALIAARDNAKAEKQRIEAAADERYRTLEESYNALESRHDSIDQALENAKRERAQLHSQLEQSRTEADDYHRKILADEHIIGSLEAELEKIKNERNALAKITQRDGRHLASMTKMLTAQISKVVDLRLAESVVEKEHRNSNATIQSLFSRSESADALIAELDQALAASRADAAALQAKNAELDRAFAASRADAEALQARNAELDQAVAASRADAEALQARNAELDQARRAAENYNQELLESTSWRITAPLRQIVRKLRGI